MGIENKRYKYDIYINQFSCIENGFDLDIIDLAIFNYIKDFSGTNECLKMHTPEGVYFWISHSKLLEEMPLLNIKTKQGLIKRVDKLIKCNIFVKHPKCEHYAKTLYKAGVNYDKLVFTDYKSTSHQQKFTPLNKSLETPSTKVEGTLNKSLENNNHYNIIDINNNNIEALSSFSENLDVLETENDLKKTRGARKFSRDDFYESLVWHGAEKKDAQDWVEYRAKKKGSFTQRALDNFYEEVKLTNGKLDVRMAVKLCADKSWVGFNHEWQIPLKYLKREEPKNTLKSIL